MHHRLLQYGEEDRAEALHAQAIFASYGWLFPQACYQGTSVWILANSATDHIFCVHCTVLEYADMEYERVIYLSETVLFILYMLLIDFIGCLWLQKYVCIKYLISASLFSMLCRFLNFQ